MTAKKSTGAGPDLPAPLSALRRGDKRAIGRLITLVENDRAAVREIIKAIYPNTGRAHIVGVTAPPGSGKSTLIDGLVHHYRKAGRSAAVVAVDVSFPFTGGAPTNETGAAAPCVARPTLIKGLYGEAEGYSWAMGPASLPGEPPLRG